MNRVGAAITGAPPVSLRHADACCKTSPPIPTLDLQQEGAKKRHSNSQVPQFLCARNIMSIQQRWQLLNPCLSLSVWPLASYLTYLSLNFLIVEMSMRMQRLRQAV